MKTEVLTPPSVEDLWLPPISNEVYVRAVSAYLADGEQNNTLRPHQDVIFHDTEKFLANGHRKGYVTSPTGTGKTVVFVELCKAFIGAEEIIGRKPRILVVEPTRDLVHQTLGATKEKGFGKFAEDLNLATYFSDSKAADRENFNEADVVLTTYDSFSLLARRFETREPTDQERQHNLTRALKNILKPSRDLDKDLFGQLDAVEYAVKTYKQVSTGQTLLGTFDIIIFDEAHNLLGESMGNLVDSIDASRTLLIGFTASPNANEIKRLDKHLPVKIHDLTFKEAVEMGLLAPIATIAVNSQAELRSDFLFTKEGDYQEGSLDYLARNSPRNELVVAISKVLVENGFPNLISCLPGQEALQARVIAGDLKDAGVAAAAVYGSVPTSVRNRYYKMFENGQLDVLTHIKILTEGYDSERAKASIEAAPTRSQIRKKQRIGRVVRPGNIALVVELADKHDPFNPPLTIADIIQGADMKNGEIYGAHSPEQQERVTNVLKALSKITTLPESIPADYSRLYDTLAEYQKIVNGRVRSSKAGHYSVSERLSPIYDGLNDEVAKKIWETHGQSPDIVLGRQGFNIKILFNVNETLRMLREVPECPIDRAYREDGELWMSAEGLVIGFKNKFPGIDADMIEERIKELGDLVEWRPLKDRIPNRFKNRANNYEVYKAYRVDDETIQMLNKQMEDYIALMAMVKR